MNSMITEIDQDEYLFETGTKTRLGQEGSDNLNGN